jgi:transcriptional regulator with XRE-family HTH domain
MTGGNTRANMVAMAENSSATPATHFGRQMRKERLAHGWTLREFSARTGINFSHLNRIENGHRPPTESVAEACDRVFPGRRGWFIEYYEESRSWMPAGFKDWREYEDKAVRFGEWSPGVVPGMLQTESYARDLIRVQPAVTDEILTARLASRTERQKRVLYRDDSPTARYVIDHAALYRMVGSPAIMAVQMERLADIATRDHVTVQVLPAVAHPATQGGFIVTDGAAYAETVVGGYVYTAEETVTRLERMFDSLRAECYRASESAAIIRKAGEIWTGESRATAAATAETA